MEKGYIGKRIKEEREKCQFSQQELASEMGWKSHSTLVAIENGTQEVKAWELLKFAELLKVSPDALYTEGAVSSPQLPVFWREMRADISKLKQEERMVLQYCQDYRLLERLCAVPPAATKELPLKICDIEKIDFQWVNHLADEVHKDLQLGYYPAELLAKCLEEDYGVLIINGPIKNSSAACVRGEFGAAILLNEKEVPWRQIFNLGHELFHLVTWNASLIEKVKGDEALFHKNEKLADAFAAALLMPSQMLNLDVQSSKLSYSSIVALARKYGVSTQAMLWRLCYLKFISKDTVEQILQDSDFIVLDKATFNKAFKTAQPVGNRFLRLAYLAFESGRLSKAKLAQILGIKLYDVEKFLSEKGFDLTCDKEIKIDGSH